MPKLIINQEKVTAASAEALTKLCPFSAISYEDGKLNINSGCKMCRLCVKKGPAGVIEYIEDSAPQINKDEWRGIAVFADCEQGEIHPVTYELLGKARELAGVTGHEIISVIIGHELKAHTKTLLEYGSDKVYAYDSPIFEHFSTTTYANAFEDFVNKVKPSSVLVGATNIGRSLAPRVAARFKTGLTADCTVLQMKENTDLVQIRPAFGGNIMAQIVSPKTRPQFCTVRYKVFSAPQILENPKGEIINMEINPAWEDLRLSDFSEIKKPKVTDISESDVLVAIGRGVKSAADIDMFKQLAELLGGELACTRPLVENGMFDASHQIGLSGKTVKPKLIIAIGISGAVQFAAGMKSSDCIIAINSDKNAPIFDIAHYCAVGDIYEIVPALIEKIKKEGYICIEK